MAAAKATGIANIRHALIEKLKLLDTRTGEKNTFVLSVKYLATTTCTSTTANMSANIELFPLDTFCDLSCLKLQIKFVTLCYVLQEVGTSIDQRRGSYIPQVIVNDVYESENQMSTDASQMIFDFKQNSS